MKNILLFFLLSTISNYTFSQNNKEIIIKQMKEEVTYLASDKLKGRKTGTKQEKKAAKYIRNKFKKHGLSPKGITEYPNKNKQSNNTIWFQHFEKKIRKNPHSQSTNNEESIKGVNVIGYCDNNQKETIIIGAHYDHLGYGHKGSLYTGKKAIHNGADDNASGVSILINLIDTLCNNQLYNYLFIAFSGEEDGLLGSSYFAKNPTINLEYVRFMLNFDMVGRLNKKREIAINGVGTSTNWRELITKSNLFDFKLTTSDSGIGPSDHTSFYLKNIPVLHFFTGQHEDYHKPSDDVEKINFDGMYSIMCYVENIIQKSSKIKDFDFQETIHNNNETPKFKVTLGIMPDYLYDGSGIKIDGITKGKTAHKHGVLKGDIIIQLGKVKITDIYKYMEGLSLFEKGEKTIIKVNRNNKVIEIPIVF